MSETPVYLHYTRDALDREYDNRAKVADSARHIAWFTSASRQTRRQLDGVLDVSYGPGEAETLDIFPCGSSSAPVSVFFHGGYWRALHKDDFSFVAGAFVPAGAVSVVVNYALIPSVDMNGLVAQCRRAMRWVYHNIARYGGDPARIHACGHSAGGHLVAMMMATDWPTFGGGAPESLVAGGLGISGLYDLTPIRLCFLNDDLGLDHATVGANSPVLLDKRNRGPLDLVYGGAEGDEYARQSRALAAIWPETRALALDGRNHFTIICELGREDSELSRLAHRLMGLASAG